jgi:hypothetical protein
MTKITHAHEHPSALAAAGRPGRHFWLHYVEMVVVMAVGMAVLAPLWDVGAGMANRPDFLQDTRWMTASMVVDMVVAMAVWMWLRGHRGSLTAEMSAAMVAPFLVLAVPVALGLLSAGGLLLWGHVLMLPAMLGVMLLRAGDYSHHHGWRWTSRSADRSAAVPG